MHSKTNYEEIRLEEISPVILKCATFNLSLDLSETFKLAERYVYDYEIELITYSKGSMKIENKIYPMSEGDIVFRKPGQLVQGIMPYSCYFLCFDMKGTSGKGPIQGFNSTVSDFQNNYKCSFLDSIPPVFHAQAPDVYKNIFEKLLDEYINPNESSTIIIKSYILRIIHEIYKDINFNNSLIPPSPHYSKLKKSIDFIHQFYNKKISLEDIARPSELSFTYFHKIFTENLTITPNEYLSKVRLDKARELLVKTSLPINKIGIDCGFDNVPYFSYVFKKYNKISPLEFRNRHSYY